MARRALLCGSAFLVAVVMLFAHLGDAALMQPDEGRNAEVAREMAVSGSWLVPTLEGHPYLDKVDNFAQKTEQTDAIKVSSEVDRVYLDASGAVEIIDTKLGRKVAVEKCGSASTVVWNPWVEKSQQMPDICNDDYRRMICVESGNVDKNRLILRPGKTAVLKVTLSSQAL